MRSIALLFALLLSACDGSDVYRGQWNATAMDGHTAGIEFEERRLRIADSTGSMQDYTYTQTMVRIQNGVRTYGIEVSDGRRFYISFPNKKDQSRGVIQDENEAPVYYIERGAAYYEANQ